MSLTKGNAINKTKPSVVISLLHLALQTWVRNCLLFPLLGVSGIEHLFLESYVWVLACDFSGQWLQRPELSSRLWTHAWARQMQCCGEAFVHFVMMALGAKCKYYGALEKRWAFLVAPVLKNLPAMHRKANLIPRLKSSERHGKPLRYSWFGLNEDPLIETCESNSQYSAWNSHVDKGALAGYSP